MSDVNLRNANATIRIEVEGKESIQQTSMTIAELRDAIAKTESTIQTFKEYYKQLQVEFEKGGESRKRVVSDMSLIATEIDKQKNKLKQYQEQLASVSNVENVSVNVKQKLAEALQNKTQQQQKSTQETEKAKIATASLTPAIQQLSEALKQNADAANKNANEQNKLNNEKQKGAASAQQITKETSNLSGAFGTAGNAAKNFVSAISQMRSATSGTVTQVTNQIMNIAPAMLSAASASSVLVGALGAVSAALVGLGSTAVGAIAYMQRLGREIRDFRNATGVDAPGAAVINLLGKEVGTNIREVGLSLAILNQLIDQATVKTENASTKALDKLGQIQDKIKDLNDDHMRRLADLWDDLQDRIEKSNLAFGRFKEDFDIRAQRRDQDYNQDILRLNEDLARAIEDLNLRHTRKMDDLARARNELIQKREQQSADIQIKLAEKIAKIEEQFANKRLGLWGQYFNANPLLRPFIKSQIDLLDQLEQNAVQSAQEQAQRELEELRNKYEQELTLLEEKIARENQDYERQLQELRERDQRRRDDLNERYNRELDDARRRYAREVEDYERHQKELYEKYEKRVEDEERRYQQALKSLRDSLDNQLQSLGSIGGGPNLEWGVQRALKRLNIDLREFSDLMKSDPQKALFTLAKALADLPPSPEKTQIIQELAGFFGVQLIPLLDELGTEGEKAAEKFQKLYPALTPTAEKLEEILGNQVKWTRVQFIFDNLVATIGQKLIPHASKLADAILKWWEDDANRTKFLADVEKFADFLGRIIDGITELVSGKPINWGDLLFGKNDNGTSMTAEQTAQNIGKMIGDVLRTAWDIVKGLLQGAFDIVKFIVELITDPQKRQELMDTGSRLMTSFVVGLSESLGIELPKLIADIGVGAMQIFIQIHLLLDRIGQYIHQNFMSTIMGVLGTIEQLVPGALKALNISDENIEKIKASHRAASQGIVTTWEDTLKGVTTISVKTADGQVKTYKASADEMKKAIQTHGQFVITHTGEVINSEKRIYDLGYSSITERTKFWNDKKQNVINIVNRNIERLVGDHNKEINTRTESGWMKNAFYVSTATSRMNTTLSQAYVDMNRTTQGGLDDIRGKFGTLPLNLVQTISSQRGVFENIGKGMVGYIQTGWASQWAEFLSNVEKQIKQFQSISQSMSQSFVNPSYSSPQNRSQSFGAVQYAAAGTTINIDTVNVSTDSVDDFVRQLRQYGYRR